MKRMSIKSLKEAGFICTDGSKATEQWVKKCSDLNFEVYERHANVMQEIDFADYTEKNIRDYVSGYYNSLEDLREQYGDDSNMVIAEIISEQTLDDSIEWERMGQKLI